MKSETINKALKKFPAAKRVAVENVSVWFRGSFEDEMNLQMDIASYSWNVATVKAIRWIASNQGGTS